MTLAGLVNRAYPSPEWAVFFEVGNATGFGARRHADAVALGVWPSRGHVVHGFEFKESRSDWLREKKDPAKAEAVAAHCDYWFVVAGSDGLVKPEELPDPWGLCVANPDRTRLLIKKPALAFPDRDRAVLKRGFVAAMLRRVTETTVPKSEFNRLVEERVKEAVAQSRNECELADLRERVERYRERIDGFQSETGIDILHGYDGPKKIGAAVRAVLSGDTHKNILSSAANQLELASKGIRKALEEWP